MSDIAEDIAKEMGDVVCAFLDKNSKDKKERLELIDVLLHCLNFERRFAMLTDEELAHMYKASLSPAETERLDKAKTEDERNELYKSFARAAYIRTCAWDEYLNGKTDEKPFTSPAKKEAKGNAKAWLATDVVGFGTGLGKEDVLIVARENGNSLAVHLTSEGEIWIEDEEKRGQPSPDQAKEIEIPDHLAAEVEFSFAVKKGSLTQHAKNLLCEFVSSVKL